MKTTNVFIAGAPKCGTTALSEYLGTHPRIFVSKPKEPHYFAKDIAPYSCCSTLDEYESLFSDVGEHETAICDASVLYLYSKYAFEEIKQYNPNAKIIIMLRSPIDYIYSYHSQLLLNADETIEDFKIAWELQIDRREGRKIPKTCRVPKLLYYEEVGNLGKQVEKLLKIFPRNQVHFILLDDLIKDARKVYKEVLEFLGLPDDHRMDFPIINDNKKGVSKRLNQFRNNPPELLMKLSWLIKKMLRIEHVHFMAQVHNLNRVKSEREPLEDQFRKTLLQAFMSDIENLEKLIGRDLSRWKKYDF